MGINAYFCPMNLAMLRDVLRYAIASWPDQKIRPNSLRSLYSADYICSQPTYQEFKQGHFWARSWAKKGYPSDGMMVERPVVFIERKGRRVESVSPVSFCDAVTLILVDDGCQDCANGGPESAETVIQRLFETMSRLLKRASEVEGYVGPSGEFLVGKPDWIAPVGYRLHDTGFAHLEDLKIYQLEPVSDRAYAVAVDIEICGCEANGIEEWSDFQAPKAVAGTKCDAC